MTSIAVLGSGTVSRALAGPWRAAGHEIVVGSRDPLRAAADLPVPGVRVTALPDAARAGDVVVNTLPGAASLGVLRGLAPHLAGKVLVDVANAVETDAQGFATAPLHPGGSLAEEIQRALPAVRVVKTLNTMHASVMAAPRTLATPPSAFLSGDDAGARRTVAALLTDLGWPPEWIVDLGDVRTARAPEAFLLLVGSLVRAWGPVPFAMSVAR
ncbi:NAD(P)-binding domain-containing protein [Streptomyces niveus]|uniref:NADPH-dependent F420 reductase n=1 Tax=Streptomyces niveus TaxID=193462 RepID=UPI002E37F147|nr:NAD(P)-binding domain-containing protein [Streptomyces niveus]